MSLDQKSGVLSLVKICSHKILELIFHPIEDEQLLVLSTNDFTIFKLAKVNQRLTAKLIFKDKDNSYIDMTIFKKHLFFLSKNSNISVLNLKTMNSHNSLQVFKTEDEIYEFKKIINLDD